MKNSQTARFKFCITPKCLSTSSLSILASCGHSACRDCLSTGTFYCSHCDDTSSEFLRNPALDMLRRAHHKLHKLPEIPRDESELVVDEEVEGVEETIEDQSLVQSVQKKPEETAKVLAIDVNESVPLIQENLVAMEESEILPLETEQSMQRCQCHTCRDCQQRDRTLGELIGLLSSKNFEFLETLLNTLKNTPTVNGSIPTKNVPHPKRGLGRTLKTPTLLPPKTSVTKSKPASARKTPKVEIETTSTPQSSTSKSKRVSSAKTAPKSVQEEANVTPVTSSRRSLSRTIDAIKTSLTPANSTGKRSHSSTRRTPNLPNQDTPENGSSEPKSRRAQTTPAAKAKLFATIETPAVFSRRGRIVEATPTGDEKTTKNGSSTAKKRKSSIKVELPELTDVVDTSDVPQIVFEEAPKPEQIQEQKIELEVSPPVEGASTLAPKQRGQKRLRSSENLMPGNLKPMVAMFTGMEPKNTKEATEIAKHFGIKVTDSWSSKVTHVVSELSNEESRTTKRTLKYLQGLLGNAWIVSPSWLFQSMNEKKLLPEEDFEINGLAELQPENCFPQKSRSTQVRLFEGALFVVANKYSKINANDVKSLIEAGGGTLVKKKDPTKRCFTILDNGKPSKTPEVMPLSDFFERICTLNSMFTQ